MRVGLAVLTVAAACWGATAAAGEPVAAQDLFLEAMRLDLGGGTDATATFALFRRAAEKGFAPAEFNVAVMLDSGRGVVSDQKQAAIWYARAASHGDHRAAFNLGQLYEAGEGVPRSATLARAWFYASTLPAARDRAAHLANPTKRSPVLTAPVCADPAAGAALKVQPDGVELVWISGEQPATVRFFVEVRDDAGREVYAGYTEISSALVQLPSKTGDLIWRVSAVSATEGRYLACDWAKFTVTPE